MFWQLSRLVLTDLPAEIGGLIVAQSDRGSGIGRRLMQYAQQWADEQGCRSVLVRSNIVRQDQNVAGVPQNFINNASHIAYFVLNLIFTTSLD